MTIRANRPILLSAAAAALLLLSACGGGEAGNELAQMDKEIAQGDIDPAVTSAIEDEILVDPALVQQSNPNGVRHPERPLQAPYPIQSGSGAGSVRNAAGPGLPADPDAPLVGGCGVPFRYGAEYAGRLPAEFPAYPGGRVTEAAGSDAGDCRTRVVSFATDHPWSRVVEFYRGAATRAGFNAEHEVRGADHMLGGVKAGTDTAYLLIVTPQGNGSTAALIVNDGR